MPLALPSRTNERKYLPAVSADRKGMDDNALVHIRSEVVTYSEFGCVSGCVGTRSNEVCEEESGQNRLLGFRPAATLLAGVHQGSPRCLQGSRLPIHTFRSEEQPTG